MTTLDQAQLAYGVDYGALRYSSVWDNLRDDPRFAKLLADAEARMVADRASSR